jgi:hypothetical protein
VQAFGFDGDDEALDPALLSLVLEAHLAVAPDLSFLALPGGSRLFTSINTVDKNLIILSSAFPQNHHREIFLIFDAADRSLRVIPAVPRSLHISRTNRVLAVRHHDDENTPYSLVIPGEAVFSDQGFAEWQDVLFISPSTSTSPWRTMKKASFPKPQLIDNFFANEVFSFRGRGYWADLLCGVMHCDCSDILSDSVEPVDFRFLDLPGPHLTDPHGRQAVAELRAFRAMGCVGDSIKFVSIDGYINRFDRRNIKDRSVTVWKLTENLKWTVEDKLSMKSLWDMLPSEFFSNYSSMQHSLPKTSLAPMYPFLSMQEHRVVYFALGEFTQGTTGGSFPTTVHLLLRVDMRHRNVSLAPIPYSPTSNMNNYIGFDYIPSCAQQLMSKGR